MTARTFAILCLLVAAVVLGSRMFLPGPDEASEQVVGQALAVIDTIERAQLTGAQATLEAQRRLTGSYAGAAVAPPVRLTRADATSYCIELQRGQSLAHLAGPSGSPEPGAC